LKPSRTLSKNIKRLLRQWCSIAYERELGAELGKLHEKFHRWEAGELHVVDLSDDIHKFHEGPARNLYVQYMMGQDVGPWLLKGSVERGVLRKNELPVELLQLLDNDSDFERD